MAKISAMPGQDIIDGFKGILDYYLFHPFCNSEKTIPCVRMWPRPPTLARTPEVQARWPAFGYVNQMRDAISPEVVAAYKTLTPGTSLIWTDIMTKGYISGDSNFLPPFEE